MCGSQKLDKLGDNTGSNDVLDGRVLFLGEQLAELGGGIVLFLDVVRVDIGNQSDQVGVELQRKEPSVPAVDADNNKTYVDIVLDFNVVLAVRHGRAWDVHVAALGQVFLTLLLSDFDRVLLSAVSHLVRTESILVLEGVLSISSGGFIHFSVCCVSG